MDIDSNTPLKRRILRQRATLYNMLIDPMQRVARRCAKVWEEKPALDHLLSESIPKVPYVTYLYALDRNARQISANASPAGLIEDDFGRDRADRPYMQNLTESKDMTLSEAYISMRAQRPSVTAIQRVYRDGEHIGYLGGDFDLRGLPITKDLYSEPGRWRQLKGDPAIRGNVFQQCRIQSRLDEHVDMILPVLEELVTLPLPAPGVRRTGRPGRLSGLPAQTLSRRSRRAPGPDPADLRYLQTPAVRRRDHLSAGRFGQHLQRDRRSELLLRRFALHPGRTVPCARLGVLGGAGLISASPAG